MDWELFFFLPPPPPFREWPCRLTTDAHTFRGLPRILLAVEPLVVLPIRLSSNRRRSRERSLSSSFRRKLSFLLHSQSSAVVGYHQWLIRSSSLNRDCCAEEKCVFGAIFPSTWGGVLERLISRAQTRTSALWIRKRVSSVGARSLVKSGCTTFPYYFLPHHHYHQNTGRALRTGPTVPQRGEKERPDDRHVEKVIKQASLQRRLYHYY